MTNTTSYGNNVTQKKKCNCFSLLFIFIACNTLKVLQELKHYIENETFHIILCPWHLENGSIDFLTTSNVWLDT